MAAVRGLCVLYFILLYTNSFSYLVPLTVAVFNFTNCCQCAVGVQIYVPTYGFGYMPALRARCAMYSSISRIIIIIHTIIIHFMYSCRVHVHNVPPLYEPRAERAEATVKTERFVARLHVFCRISFNTFVPFEWSERAGVLARSR